jgi:hypothetical protein
MWEKKQTADGTVYYQDANRGLVQWTAPDDFDPAEFCRDTLHGDAFAEFSEFTMEDNFLFELQSIGLFTRQKDVDVSSGAMLQDVSRKITFLKGKLEDGVGLDSEWEVAMATNNFALVHFLLGILNFRVDAVLSSSVMQCLAFAGTLYPKVWADFVNDEVNLQILCRCTIHLTANFVAIVSTKKSAKSSSSPYLGFDERDISDFNLVGVERDGDEGTPSHGVSGLEGHDDRDSSILVCLMLLSQFFAKEISLLKCSVDTSVTTAEDIERVCALSADEVDAELSVLLSEKNISPGRFMRVMCRALVFSLPLLAEDAYLLAIKAIAALNRQNPIFDAIQSTEIAKMCAVLHFDGANAINISEVMHFLLEFCKLISC